MSFELAPDALAILAAAAASPSRRVGLCVQPGPAASELGRRLARGGARGRAPHRGAGAGVARSRRRRRAHAGVGRAGRAARCCPLPRGARGPGGRAVRGAAGRPCREQCSAARGGHRTAADRARGLHRVRLPELPDRGASRPDAGGDEPRAVGRGHRRGRVPRARRRRRGAVSADDRGLGRPDRRRRDLGRGARGAAPGEPGAWGRHGGARVAPGGRPVCGRRRAAGRGPRARGLPRALARGRAGAAHRPGARRGRGPRAATPARSTRWCPGCCRCSDLATRLAAATPPTSSAGSDTRRRATRSRRCAPTPTRTSPRRPPRPCSASTPAKPPARDGRPPSSDSSSETCFVPWCLRG